jgi:hypothetical protein
VVLPSVLSVFCQWHQRFNPAGLVKFERMREEGCLDWVYEDGRIRGDYLRGIGYSGAIRLIFLAVLLVLP